MDEKIKSSKVINKFLFPLKRESCSLQKLSYRMETMDYLIISSFFGCRRFCAWFPSISTQAWCFRIRELPTLSKIPGRVLTISLVFCIEVGKIHCFRTVQYLLKRESYSLQAQQGIIWLWICSISDPCAL